VLLRTSPSQEAIKLPANFSAQGPIWATHTQVNPPNFGSTGPAARLQHISAAATKQSGNCAASCTPYTAHPGTHCLRAADVCCNRNNEGGSGILQLYSHMPVYYLSLPTVFFLPSTFYLRITPATTPVQPRLLHWACRQAPK
jgi:hypothetical protein